MSVSKAILSWNYQALKSVIEEETNEVYSTLLFESYGNMRIEKMLFLEAFNWICELMPKHVYHSGAHLGYNDLVSKPKKAIGERLFEDDYKLYRHQSLAQSNIIETHAETIKIDPNLTRLLVYIKENYSKFIREKRFEFGKIAFVLDDSKSRNLYIYYNGCRIFEYYSDHSTPYYFYLQLYTYYGSHTGYDPRSKTHTLTGENKLIYNSVPYQTYNPETELHTIEKSLLLNRLCEILALKEQMVSSM